MTLRFAAILYALLTVYLNSVFCLAQSPASAFFQISSTGNEPVLFGLSPAGWLSWSNQSLGSNYTIQRSYALTPPQWEPLYHGVATNQSLSIKVTEPNLPDGMQFLPGGLFTMGDILGDLNNATPVHTVFLSPFFMGRFEVTVAQLATVLQWANERGLVAVAPDGKSVLDQKGTNLMELDKHNSQIVFGPTGFSVKAGQAQFPAPYISWFGALSYCNWLSEMEQREPCYNLTNWTCDFSRSGYRLPTEAEWEFAARGGHYGMRFPWGNTNVITHSEANYNSSTNFAYDVSPTGGLHPLYFTNAPPSSPVGAFAPNNYGLYDMSGNVWEWVWDWSSRYLSGHQVDPTGPETGVLAVFRGGSWQTKAGSTIVAARYRSSRRSDTIEDVGFRVVLPFHPASQSD